MYLESARRDLQNDEIYQNFLEFKKLEVVKLFFNFQRILLAKSFD